MKLLASVVATTFAVQSENLCPSYYKDSSGAHVGGCYEQEGIWQQDGSADAIRCKMTNPKCIQINCKFDGIQAEFRNDLFDNNPDQLKFIKQIKSGQKEVVDKFGNSLVAPCKVSVGDGDFGGNSVNIDWSYEDCSHLMDISLQGDEIVYSVKLSVAGDDIPGDDIEFYVDHKMGADCKYDATIELDSNFWVNQEDVEAAEAELGDFASEFSCDFYSDEQRLEAITANNIVNMGDTIYGQVTSKALHGISYNLNKVTVSDADNNQLSFDVIENGGSVAAVNSNIVNDQTVTGGNIDFDWMSFGFAGKTDQNKLSVQCFVDLKPNNIPECPTGYEILELSGGNKQCIQVNKGRFKWSTAKSTCADDGAWLAFPENEEDNKIFSDLIGYGKYDLWIGVECFGTELGGYPNKPKKPWCNSWLNTNNKGPITWFNWNGDTKEPNNAKKNEFMVHIILTDGGKKAWQNGYGEPGNFTEGNLNGKWNDHISHDDQADWADKIQYSKNNAFICMKAPNTI